MAAIGRQLLVIGAIIAGIGALLLVSARFAHFPLGRLPGDIVIGRGRWRLYFPLMTSILLSLVLSAVLWLLRRR